MLFIALPVPVIVSNFAYYYSKERNRQMTREISPEEGSSTSSGDTIRALICCPTVNERNKCTRRQDNNGKISREKGTGSFSEIGGPSDILLQNNNGNPRMGPESVLESNV